MDTKKSKIYSSQKGLSSRGEILRSTFVMIKKYNLEVDFQFYIRTPNLTKI